MTDETHALTQNPTGPAPMTGAQSGETPQVAAARTPGAHTSAAQTFDAWLAAQDDATRRLIDAHTVGLKGALDSERGERKSLAKQMRDLSAKAEEGSDLRKRLDSLTGDMEAASRKAASRKAASRKAASRKAAFYESAPSDAANLRLAWLAAQDGGLIGPDGKADWNRLRAHETVKRRILEHAGWVLVPPVQDDVIQSAQGIGGAASEGAGGANPSPANETSAMPKRRGRRTKEVQP